MSDQDGGAPAANVPIDQTWVNGYIGRWLDTAQQLGPTSAMYESCLLRANYAMDLIDAWRSEQARKRT